MLPLTILPAPDLTIVIRDQAILPATQAIAITTIQDRTILLTTTTQDQVLLLTIVQDQVLLPTTAQDPAVLPSVEVQEAADIAEADTAEADIVAVSPAAAQEEVLQEVEDNQYIFIFKKGDS